MPDEPTPSPDDDEREEIRLTLARLVLASIEKDLPQNEWATPKERLLFEEGFGLGIFAALDSLEHSFARDVSPFDHTWTKEQIGNWLDDELYAILARREQREVESLLRRILRDEEGDE